jgi:hypothetical protein
LAQFFNDRFRALLADVLEVLFKLAGTLLHTILSKLLYRLLIIFLKLLDFLAAIFDIFSGVRYIHYHDGVYHLAQVSETVYRNGVPTIVTKGVTYIDYQQTYLLDLFLQSGPVARAFLLITFFSATLALIFTIYAVTKSISDMTLDGKNPIGKVLGRALKAAGTFIMVPLMAFVCCSCRPSSSWRSTTSFPVTEIPPAGPSHHGHDHFSDRGLNAGQRILPSVVYRFSARRLLQRTKSYTDYNQVEKDFDLEKFDILTCILSTLLIIVNMFLAFLCSYSGYSRCFSSIWCRRYTCRPSR